MLRVVTPLTSPPTSPPSTHPSTDDLGDLHSFDTATMTWTLLSAGGFPFARSNHGFTSAGGKLYVHGGTSGFNEKGKLGSPPTPHSLSCLERER